jgi:hypothetical protein
MGLIEFLILVEHNAMLVGHLQDLLDVRGERLSAFLHLNFL